MVSILITECRAIWSHKSELMRALQTPICSVDLKIFCLFNVYSMTGRVKLIREKVKVGGFFYVCPFLRMLICMSGFVKIKEALKIVDRTRTG